MSNVMNTRIDLSLADEKNNLNFILRNCKKTPSPKPKREISWEDKEYQDNVVLEEMIARSEIWMLDRKASVGPCYRPGMPFEGPSGITICLPKKSFKAVNQSSGISINISRKSLVKDKKLEADEQDVYECSFNKFLCSVKAKFGNLQSKIKNVLHM